MSNDTPGPSASAPGDGGRIADVLILTFTAGVSLLEWERTGGLEREWAIYRRLVPTAYPRMIAVTHGGADDLEVARRAGLGDAVSVVCNDKGLERAVYEASIPGRVRGLVDGLDARSAVVKTNQFKGGAVAAAIARELRGAGVRAGLLARAGYHWSRHVARDEGPGSLVAVEAAALEGELCRAADVIAVTTGAIADDVSWRHAVASSRVRVVPNYVMDEVVDAGASSPGAARAGRERGTVLVAGRLHPRKRVDLAIRAAAACISARRLVIVGDGPERSSLERLARALGVSATFTGRLSHRELLAHMGRCDVFLQCALFEGHPKTVLEAMGAGAAVVVADTPGLGDVVRDGRTGVRVPFDPAEPADRAAARFAEAIDLVLSDDALRARLGRAAADHVRATLTLSAILPHEIAAHRAALEAGTVGAASASRPTLPPVRWDPALLGSPPAAAVAAFERGIHGYVKRLPARERCEFLFGLDWPLYQMQGMAAGELEGGMHPKHRLLRYHDFFVNRVQGGERVIDLGCGNGALMCSIASRAGGENGGGAHVTGIELNPATAAKARARAAERNLSGRITVYDGDITALRAPAPGAFDVLVLSNVLEHIDRRPERLAMWREWYGARRWLIRVPAFDREWRAPFKKELGVEWRLDVTHETEYTRDQLERELAQAGLAIDELIVNWGEYWCSARPAARSNEDSR